MLQQAMPRLLAAVQPDEEVIAIDAASTDGSTEYLQSLHAAGKIHQFISEPDRGEAHGLNKGILRARGDLVKVITDDDVFYWPAIQACKHFMLENPEVDMMAGNVAHVLFERPDNIVFVKEYERDFRDWLAGKFKRVRFSGLPLMIRRERIALFGLFRAGLIPVDFEFTLRVTGLANVAWNTSVIALRIDNAASNYRVHSARALEEVEQISTFYQWKEPKDVAEPGPVGKFWQQGRFWAGRIKRKLLGNSGTEAKAPVPPADAPATRTPAEVFALSEAWVNEYNRTHPSELLVRPVKK